MNYQTYFLEHGLPKTLWAFESHMLTLGVNVDDQAHIVFEGNTDPEHIDFCLKTVTNPTLKTFLVWLKEI